MFRHSSIDVYNRRQFKFVQSANIESNAIEIILCKQCSKHLPLETKKKQEKGKNVR